MLAGMDPFDSDPPFDPERRYTTKEYLAYEMSAQWRYDLRDGRIRPCPPSDYEHVSIMSDLLCAVSDRLDDTPYEVFTSNVRVVVDHARCFLHPDLSVIDRRPRLMPPTDNISLLEPRVVFEIYSAES